MSFKIIGKHKFFQWIRMIIILLYVKFSQFFFFHSWSAKSKRHQMWWRSWSYLKRLSRTWRLIPPASVPWVWAVRSFFPFFYQICLYLYQGECPCDDCEDPAVSCGDYCCQWASVEVCHIFHFSSFCLSSIFRDVTTSAATTETAGARKTTVITARTLSSSPSSRRSRRESARLDTSRTAMTAKASAPRYI